LAAVAKVLLSMEGGVIPANLHYSKPNPDIPALADGRLKVVSENTPWEGGYVGVNSFGFGGSNVHVLLRSNHTHAANGNGVDSTAAAESKRFVFLCCSSNSNISVSVLMYIHCLLHLLHCSTLFSYKIISTVIIAGW
jgi:acyl transferase domain-containing protein